MPEIEVYVDGLNRSKLVDRRVGALSYSRDINGQGNARFTLADTPDGFVPADGMEVLIKEDGTDRFGGIINARPRGFRGPDSSKQLTFYQVSVASWEQRLNKRRVWRSYTDVSFATIVTDLGTDFLSGEGLTLSVLAGSTLSVTFNGETVAECLDILCSLETDGRSWYVTPAKVLTIDVQSATLAPVELNRRNIDLENPPTVEPDRNGYANTITVVGGNPDMPILYTARDATEIAARVAAEGGSGIYHDVVEDNEVVTEGQAQQRAEGMLLQRKVLREKFVARTRESGFEVGQQVTVDLPNLGISSTDYFIIGVETSLAPGARELWHTITAVDGFLDGSWHSEYRRKIPPKTIPMQIESTPGLVRVEPQAGVLIHDPPREPHEWFQGALSGALGVTASTAGLSPDGDWYYTVRRGPVATPRQTIAEAWAIDENNVVATTPSVSASWNELFSGGVQLKNAVAVSPNSRYIAVIQYDADVGDGSFIIVDMELGVRLGVCNYSGPDNASPGDPLWVGNYVYWPMYTSDVIHVYDVSDRDDPTEAATFTVPSLSTVESIVAADAGGSVLYACGTGGIVSIDASNPISLVEVDSVGSGDYESLALDERGYLAAAVRADASNCLVIIVEAVGTTLTVEFEGNVALATGTMEGVAAVHYEGALTVLNIRDVATPNALRAHVFNTVDVTAPTFTETITYTHGPSSNFGPVRSLEARQIAYDFNSSSDVQLIYGVTVFDKIVPYEVELPLRAAFGGTGIESYVVGNLIVATGRTTLGTVLPPAGDDEVLTYDAGEPGLVKWGKLKPASAIAAVWLLEY